MQLGSFFRNLGFALISFSKQSPTTILVLFSLLLELELAVGAIMEGCLIDRESEINVIMLLLSAPNMVSEMKGSHRFLLSIKVLSFV